ncbi:hypothetical protein niasHT_030252 [Heterodera trifolii]|uniref:Uncharacterized protein n=1 Tax=Heterodera trifolii TaxID=157864 RepID=A0ABD2JFJ2_9BILA
MKNETIPFNALITRYEELQHQRAHQAYSYVYGNADRIRDIMRDICYEQELSLPECLNRIKREFPALRAFATYRSLLFLHTRGIRKSDATIPTAVTSFTTAGGTQTTQLVKLFHNPGITSMAHFYKLFFFLIAALFPIFCSILCKLKLLENTDGNLCRATDERTYKLTTKLCPPPEDPNFTLCSTFTKSVWQKDYWQKQGAIDVWMKFFERAPNRAEMEKEFFSQLDNPLLGKAFKLAIIGEWLAANSLDQGSYTPTNSELLEFWVSKRAPDRLLACEHGVVDYEIEGSKVKTNVLFEAATTAGNLPNIFKDKKCAAFEKLQEERFKQEVHEFKQRGGGGGIFGGIGNLFRSGGR